MKSFFTPFYRTGNFIPVVHAYYDRADMIRTTIEETSHAHTLCEIMYVNEGNIAVDIERAQVSLGRKQFIWLDANVHHQLVLDDSAICSVMNIEFQLEELPPRCPTIETLYRTDASFRTLLERPAPYFVLTDTDDTIYNLLKQIIQLADSTHPEAEALCSMLTTQVLLLMARRRQLSAQSGNRPIRNSYISSALEYIHEHYCEHITVQEIASTLHVQPTYLHRLFKEYTDVTVGEYITQLRIRHAQSLLSDTNDTLLSIATAVGMSSQQRFSMLFRRHVGMTPSEYRLQTQMERPTLQHRRN